MATLCPVYGTSPTTQSFFPDITPSSLCESELFDFEDFPTIYGDIQKIESDMGNNDCSIFQCDVRDLDIKPELRNTDLMWSQPNNNTILGTSASSVSSDICPAVPPSVVMGNNHIKSERGSHQQLQRPPPTVVTAKKFNLMEIVVKQEPDVEQRLELHNIPNTKATTIDSLPAGSSLLKPANQQQQKKMQRSSIQIPKRGDQLLPSAANSASNSSLTSLKSSSYSICNSSSYHRPDTPHSLVDDCISPEFRHNVDLTACVIGSNNISLTSDPANFINHVSQELQDTSKNQIDTRLISVCSLTEVWDAIKSADLETTAPAISAKKSASSTLGGYSNCLSVNTSGSQRSSDSDSDEESITSSDQEVIYGAGGVSPVSSQSSKSTHNYMHSDHSYTRSKDGMDDMRTNHLDTPSDSEEEIDVVSINDKKLPTNPSDEDRRDLQSHLTERLNDVVKTPNGIRTLPPRRRGSYELPYTPASNSPVKSVNNSRFPSPAATPYQNQYKYAQQQLVSAGVTGMGTGKPINILISEKSRKRLLVNGTLTSTAAGTTIINGEVLATSALPPSKKHRGKKTKHVAAAVQLQPGLLKRHYSVDETADTIEKRNLHNDMERQRRIGLKNLFEALKKQIPSIKDKERAPKVNILREAAKLCEALTREDQQLNEQKAKLKEELRRKQELLNQLRQLQKD